MLVTPAHSSSVSAGAKAVVQLVYLIVFIDIRGRYWIPAFAGMSAKPGLGPRLGRCLTINSQPLSKNQPIAQMVGVG